MRKINIKHTIDLLPHEHIESKVDEYALFMKEYNNSNKYRLVFSFNPVCSNILFNTITEIVENEGSPDCILFNKNYDKTTEFLTINSSDENKIGLYNYLDYTKRIDTTTTPNRTYFLNKNDMIMDTGYSHPEIGNFEYHCGYDIFDNHILRSKEFVVVNKINNSITTPNQRQCFNTLSDYLRDNIGTIKQDRNLKEVEDTNPVSKHLYTTDTLLSFNTSINENLTEDNGWLGFVNKGNLNIPNYIIGEKEMTINRVLNNKDVGSFIDMYPDRSLYSIIPKFNKFRKRYENNWEFCLTYPFENDYNNELVTKHGYNGIECVFKLDGTLQIGTAPNTKIVTLRTFVEHGLEIGDKIKLAYFLEDSNGNLKYLNGKPCSGETVGVCNVVGNGSNIYEKKQYIKIRIGDIQNLIHKLWQEYNNGIPEDVFALERDFFEEENVKFRFSRVVGDSKCKYYIRKFKKLKKPDGGEYSYTSNKLAYSKNIYDDRIGEVLFDEIIDVTGIKNNLGIPLHEIFVSVFKTNYGYKEWYGTVGVNAKATVNTMNTTGDSIEFSHCFGEITSGFDMPSDEDCIDYNVHRFHNIKISNSSSMGIIESGKTLESDISLRGTSDVFCGDLIEFSEKALSEKVLEDVHYRFNTAQRETSNQIFSALTYNEINYDDYDVSDSANKDFIVLKNIALNDNGVSSTIPVNLNPEGYYYKPHYRIQLNEYSPRVYWGKDTLVNIVSSSYIRSGMVHDYTTYDEVMYRYEIVCDKIYYMTIYDKVYFVNKTNNNVIVYGEVVKFNNEVYDIVINETINISDYNLFKVDPAKPEDAYTLKDGSGKYNWRIKKSYNDIDSDSALYNRPFTNGVHYLHENINLYLKRQDPNGYYGLSFNSDMPLFKTSLVILGNEKEVNNKEYVENIEQGQC